MFFLGRVAEEVHSRGHMKTEMRIKLGSQTGKGLMGVFQEEEQTVQGP